MKHLLTGRSLCAGLLKAAAMMAQKASAAPRQLILIIGDGIDEQQFTIARNYLKAAAGH